MCFKKPKAPKPVDTGADPALTRERMQAEQDNAAIKAENKQRRMEDQLAVLSGRVGRKSLFTGGQGGVGYPAANRRLAPGPGTPPPSPGGGGPSGSSSPGTPTGSGGQGVEGGGSVGRDFPGRSIFGDLDGTMRRSRVFKKTGAA